jgi:hypothetical protein
MLIFLYIKIINNENKLKNKEILKQIQSIFHTIIKTNIYESDKWQDFNNDLRYNNDPFKSDKKICLLKISNNGIEINTN